MLKAAAVLQGVLVLTLTLSGPALANDRHGTTVVPSSSADASAHLATLAGVQDLATPTLVQHVASSANPEGSGIDGNGFTFTLPNGVRAGNCLILGITYMASPGRTVSITDTNGNIWPRSPAVSANHHGAAFTYTSEIYVLPNANAGVTTITVTFDAAFRPFQYTISEFYNIATASPVSGSSATHAVAAPNLTTGSFTPGDNDANGGNLIWSYFAPAWGASGSPSSWAPGTSFSLLDADTAWQGASNTFPHASEYFVQSTAAAINPGINATEDTTNFYSGVSIALRAASGGSAPPPGIRIVKIIHLTSDAPPSGPWRLQVPTTGNLLALLTHQPNLITFSSVTDNKGSPYTLRNLAGDENQIWHTANSNAANDLIVTAHVSSPEPPTSSVVAYDITGAAASPFDVIAGFHNSPFPGQTTVNNAPQITPTTRNGLVLVVADNGKGPVLGFASGAPATAIFDLVTYQGETDDDLMENADGKGHVYNADTRQISWHWTITPNSEGGIAATSVAFKAAEANPPDANPPTVSSVSPASGPTSGGTAVTITGSNFRAGATAAIGGVALTDLSVTDTTVTGTTGAHAANPTSAVVVTNPDTQSATCSCTFTYDVATSSGLVAAYAFEEGTGTATADATGKGHTGTVNSATWTDSGKFGRALSFNGSTSYVDLGNAADLRITGSMTWNAWIFATANPVDDGQIISKSTGAGWQVKTSPDTGPHTFGVAVSATGTSLTQRYSTTVRQLNTWYHVAGVYNAPARTLDIYVNGVLDNGVLVGTVPASQFDAAVNVNIGRRGGGFYFQGTIDEVRVYDRALSQAEIQTDMNSAIGGP